MRRLTEAALRRQIRDHTEDSLAHAREAQRLEAQLNALRKAKAKKRSARSALAQSEDTVERTIDLAKAELKSSKIVRRWPNMALSKQHQLRAVALYLLHRRARYADETSSTAIKQRERAERNRDMWKGQCERQAAQLTTMRQEHDEAYERAVQAILGASSLDENGYIVTKDAAIKAIRRLAAGTEKEGNDET